MEIKTLIAEKLIKPFKSSGMFNRERFWILYWAYRLTGWHIRHKEWDYVLEYFPKLHDEKQFVRVLDVGSTSSLFPYELMARGYMVHLLDQRPFQEKVDWFIQRDITEFEVYDKYNFVTCISVLEHVGNDGKGDLIKQQKALENMINSLVLGGRLLLTIPTHEFAQTHIWHGFSYSNLEELLPENAFINDCQERAGQLCFVIEKL